MSLSFFVLALVVFAISLQPLLSLSPCLTLLQSCLGCFMDYRVRAIIHGCMHGCSVNMPLGNPLPPPPPPPPPGPKRECSIDSFSLYMACLLPLLCSRRRGFRSEVANGAFVVNYGKGDTREGLDLLQIASACMQKGGKGKKTG